MGQMTAAMAGEEPASPGPTSDSCWLGSVCVAGIVAFAMPMQPLPAYMERIAPL